jgi:hypothetical protein
VRLLRLAGDDEGRLKVYVKEAVEKAIIEVGEELGLK